MVTSESFIKRKLFTFSKMKTILIAAMTKDGVIGNGNQVPWNIPKERELFNKITEGSTIIMGKNTFLSIGKPLPNRNNIVVSTSLPELNGYTVCDTLKRALRLAKSFGKDIYIAGGADIYQQMIAHTYVASLR